MSSLIAFIKSKSFLKQVSIVTGAWIVFVSLVMFMLGFYTHNGEKVEVPNFKGKTKAELDKFIESTDLRYSIIDSVFDLKAQKGAVADQVPKPGAFVKKDRIIYLTVNAILPPKVKMPNLIDLTLRQATARIETYGLRVGRLSYIPDLAENAVLKQMLGGQEVKPGTLVNKGSSVNLVVGSGLGNEDIFIPNLIGLTKSEATLLVESSSLTIGAILWDAGIKDTATAKIYKQAPLYKPDSRIGSGQSMDIFLTNDLTKVKPDTLTTH